MAKLTQKEKVLKAFQEAPENKLSTGYLKRELFVSEANARISELRYDGYVIEKVGEDEHGYAIQQLISSPKKRKLVRVEKVMIDGVLHARPIYEYA